MDKLSTLQMLGMTEEGNKWISEGGSILEHKKSGIKWELTDRFMSLGQEVLGLKWERYIKELDQTEEGSYKRDLLFANYSWDMIKDWSEEKCEAEVGAWDLADFK